MVVFITAIERPATPKSCIGPKKTAGPDDPDPACDSPDCVVTGYFFFLPPFLAFLPPFFLAAIRFTTFHAFESDGKPSPTNALGKNMRYVDDIVKDLFVKNETINLPRNFRRSFPRQRSRALDAASRQSGADGIVGQQSAHRSGDRLR